MIPPIAVSYNIGSYSSGEEDAESTGVPRDSSRSFFGRWLTSINEISDEEDADSARVLRAPSQSIFGRTLDHLDDASEDEDADSARVLRTPSQSIFGRTLSQHDNVLSEGEDADDARVLRAPSQTIFNRIINRVDSFSSGEEEASSRRVVRIRTESIYDRTLNRVDSRSDLKIEDPLHTPIKMQFCPSFFCTDQTLMLDWSEIKQTLLTIKGVNVSFDDEDYRITFSHSEKEIPSILRVVNYGNIFPDHMSVVSLKVHGELGDQLFEADVQNNHSLFRKRKEDLLRDASALLQQREKCAVEMPNEVREGTSFVELLLESYEGFCLGEQHKDISPKEFLIQNMDLFKKLGVKTLYLEHLFYDSMQKELDHYFMGSDLETLCPYLENYLQYLDTGFNVASIDFNYSKLIRAAKAAGISVVGIDTTISCLCGLSEGLDYIDAKIRCEAMNATAVQIIDEQQRIRGGKYIALMGSAHVATCAGVPGVAELLQVPSVVIEDGEEESLQYNVKNLHDFVPHVTIYTTVKQSK